MSTTGGDDDARDFDDADTKYPEPDLDGLEEGGAKEVHDAFLEHRLSGRRVADPVAYNRALRQFERLAGAVPTSPRGAPPTGDDRDDGPVDADKPFAPPRADVDDRGDDREDEES